MNEKTFEIPVPWGVLAAKSWGDKTKTFVLLLHGAFDNLGSFEPLISHLRNDFYYIAVDISGHGQSSKVCENLSHMQENFIFSLKLILDYFNREKYIIIGHSWSGTSAFAFASLYPEKVLKLIILDMVFGLPLSMEYFKQFFRERINYWSRTHLLQRPKPKLNFTYDQGLRIIQKGRMVGSIKKEASEVLAKRGLTPIEGGKYEFSASLSPKQFFSFLYGIEFVNNLMMVLPIECPVLFILANDSIPQREYFKTFFKELWKKNKQCFVRKVNGTHDAHLTCPEDVAPIINAFLIHKAHKL